jgi:hypothetical protein
MIAGFAAGVALTLLVLWDAFETVILPRRVTRRFRLTRAFYALTWIPWSSVASLVPGKRRDTLLSVFGPLSLLLLLGVWAVGLVIGFALLQWSLRSQLNTGPGAGFGTYLYMSGTTFFTLGLGDIVPADRAGRALTVLEAGTGFGFLALVLGYLPVLYQAFSRREVSISLLDARAGSPPTAAELLRRLSHDGGPETLGELLHDWERWAAELMESHLSYPVLAFFRSQHDNQSWLGALTAILDTSALVMIACDGSAARQARLTFAMARHAIVDLSQVLGVAPAKRPCRRMESDEWERLQPLLGPVACKSADRTLWARELSRLRGMYEPFVTGLADHLHLGLPPWAASTGRADNWQTSAWKGPALETPGPSDDDHS